MMKNRYLIYTSCLVMACSSFLSCQKEDGLDDKSVLDLSPVQKTELDHWIDDRFTDPYNIAVFYRWDQYKSDMDRYLVPPVTESVIPALNVVQGIWLDTYKEIAGELFVKQTAPRELLLVGSKNMNTNGTVTLGLAEQGYRITLFELDGLKVHQEAAVKEYIHTIQHEYVHILNQHKRFDIATYEKITPGTYRDDWHLTTDQQAWDIGYISRYARSNSGEDFAEQAAWMLRDIVEYEAKVNAITSVTGKANIRKKEQLVVSYYKEAFGIDFYELCRLARVNTLKIVNG